jgi:hypothetical protein
MDLHHEVIKRQKSIRQNDCLVVDSHEDQSSAILTHHEPETLSDKMILPILISVFKPNRKTSKYSQDYVNF